MGIFNRKKKDGSKEEEKKDKKGASSDSEKSAMSSLKDVRQTSMRLRVFLIL